MFQIRHADVSQHSGYPARALLRPPTHQATVLVFVVLGREKTNELRHSARTPLLLLHVADKFPAAYGRVANLRSEDTSQTTYSPPEDQGGQQNLVDHFLALTLALLFESGFQQVGFRHAGLCLYTH